MPVPEAALFRIKLLGRGKWAYCTAAAAAAFLCLAATLPSTKQEPAEQNQRGLEFQVGMFGTPKNSSLGAGNLTLVLLLAAAAPSSWT